MNVLRKCFVQQTNSSRLTCESHELDPDIQGGKFSRFLNFAMPSLMIRSGGGLHDP